MAGKLRARSSPPRRKATAPRALRAPADEDKLLLKKKLSRPAAERFGRFSETEVMSLVAAEFTSGRLPSEIPLALRKTYGIYLRREEPWRLLADLAEQGSLTYHAGLEFRLARRLCRHYAWPEDRVSVVEARDPEAVAAHGARVLLELIRRQHDINRQLAAQKRATARKFVSVGMAGGEVIQKLAKKLHHPLSEASPESLPPEVRFHAMVGIFGVDRDPARDPSTFFSFLALAQDQQPATTFVGLPAPGIVTVEEYKKLLDIHGIAEAFSRKPELDIIVSSAGHWAAERKDGKDKKLERGHHSVLSRVLHEASEETVNRFHKLGACGDFMFSPVGQKGAVEINSGKRAMTLMELSEIPSFIDRGKRVLALIGPCGVCNKPAKVEVLHLLLQHGLLTDLVVDAETARLLVDRRPATL